MSVTVVGTSHHTSPAEVRERFVFPRAEAEAAAASLVTDGVATEAVLLSTCNRTEFYLATLTPERAAESATRLMAERAGLGDAEAAGLLYVRSRTDAVRHLYRVVTSLDSMILGEAQIHGQVKAAYEEAQHATMPLVGPVLSRLFQGALAVGGRVRSETTLGMGAASVPSAAVELARKIFGSLRGRRALVIGAGEMAELAIGCFGGERMSEIIVASRTQERAQIVAERAGGRAVAFAEVAAVLPSVDIVAAATSAPHAVLTRELVDRAHPDGRRRPLLVVDIAIPRDVEPAVGELEYVFLYGIDDLRQIVDENLGQRQSAIPAAESLIDAAVGDFGAWYAARDVVPLIRALRDGAEEVRRAEVDRLFRKLRHLSPEEREAVEALTKQLLNKVLHAPTVRLREAAGNGNGVSLVEAARYLFDIDPEEGTSAS